VAQEGLEHYRRGENWIRIKKKEKEVESGRRIVNRLTIRPWREQ